MKKLGMFLMLLLAFTIQSHHVFAQSVTITLMPGWNWISVPLMDTLDFETALGSFTPMQGDIIKSQWSNAICMGNGQWRGPISQFYPGYGYMYKSNRPMPVTVTFNVQQPAPQVIVTTMQPTEITSNSAICGGNVASSNGDYVSVTLKGICWSTSPNPTFNDNYIEVENGIGSFIVSMSGLTLGATYHVRAFAVTENGTVYGEQKTFSTKDGIPTLTTDSVTGITGTNASCGGSITDDGGLAITARGVCWSISPNPTIEDSHTIDSCGMGVFNSSIRGLNSNTIYYVRAYATNSYTTAYGEQLSFTTLDLEYVDLGLPSGTLWATCNVGASSPEDYGDYFSWAEVGIRSNYDWSNYRYCHGNSVTLTKYCSNSRFGYNNYTDNLTTLQSSDDAARTNWGGNWRMSTKVEWEELYQNTINTWTTQNGVNGWLFIASNGNSLFLPVAGYRNESELYDAGSSAYYWSSWLYVDYPSQAWYFFFNSDSYSMGSGSRSCGRSIRAVRSTQ